MVLASYMLSSPQLPDREPMQFIADDEQEAVSVYCSYIHGVSLMAPTQITLTKLGKGDRGLWSKTVSVLWQPAAEGTICDTTF